MGIKNLLQNIKETERRVHVSSLRGKRVAVDCYCWLHRAVLSCAFELTHDRPTRKYVDYMISRTNLLLKFGCVPIMVFDGRDIPLKEKTNKNRSEARAQNLQRGLQLCERGDYEAATPLLAQSILITTQMAYSVIKELRQMGVTCLVAPYEADAQLAFLARKALVDVVITEDSDLLVYGTPVIWYKFDRSGNAIEQRYAEVRRHLASTAGFEDFEFTQMVSLGVIAGCDYLSSLNGIGVRKASKLVSRHCNISEIIVALSEDAKYSDMKAELRQYAMNFERAIYAFLHHLVYDTQAQRIVHFTPLGMKSHRESLIGEIFDANIAKSVCEDISVDPITLIQYRPQGPDERKLTDFFNIEISQQERKVSLMHQKNHKRSLREILQAQDTSLEKKKSDSMATAALVSRTKVVSRFFSTSNKHSDPSPMIDSLSQSYRVVTDDPPRSLPSTQCPNGESSDLLQTPVVSMDAATEGMVMKDQNKCIDRSVQEIAHVAKRHRSSCDSRGTLSVKSVDEIVQVMEDMESDEF